MSKKPGATSDVPIQWFVPPGVVVCPDFAPRPGHGHQLVPPEGLELSPRDAGSDLADARDT